MLRVTESSFLFEEEDRPPNSIWRICFDHSYPQVEQSLLRLFLRLKDGGLRHFHFSRGLRTSLPGLLTKSFGETTQFILRDRLFLRHMRSI